MSRSINGLRNSFQSLLATLYNGATRRPRLRRRSGELVYPFSRCAEVLESRALLSAPAFGNAFDVGFYYAGGTCGSGGNAVVVDAASNSYVAGGFQGGGDLDPSVAGAMIDSQRIAYSSFIAKYDASLNLKWVTPLITSAGQADTRDVAIGPSGDIYVAGDFQNSLTLPTVQGTSFTVTAPTGTLNGAPISLLSGFVARFDHNTGGVVWMDAFTNESNGHSIGTKVRVDSSENVYLAGSIYNFTAGVKETASLANAYGSGTGGVPVTLNNASGTHAEFFVKLDSNGNSLWGGQFVNSNSTSRANGGDMAVDGAGDVYYTAALVGTVDIDPSAATKTLTSAGGSDILIEKLDTNGHLVWVQQNGTRGNEGGQAIAVDIAGNVDVAFSGVYTAKLKKPTTGDLAQFDSAGNLKWLATTGYNDVLAIAVDPANNLYMLRRGSGGIFKYTAAGTLVWNAPAQLVGADVAIDPLGNIFWTGSIDNPSGQDNVSPDPLNPVYLPVYGDGASKFVLGYWTQPGGFAATMLASPTNTPSTPANRSAVQPVIYLGDVAPLPALLPIEKKDDPNEFLKSKIKESGG